MSLCAGWSLVSHRHGYTTAITLFCRAWSCVDCQPYRMAALKRMARNGNPTTFMTLTVNPARGQDMVARARELADALKVLIKRARRKFTKGPIEYLAVFEETKKGAPHLHLLMRAPYIPQPWLSATMNELIQAPIVDIRRVSDAKHASFYIAKYVGKGPKSFGSLKRYWSTPNYEIGRAPLPDKDDLWGSGWYVERVPLFMLAEVWLSKGFLIEWMNPNRWVHAPGNRTREGPWPCAPLAA